MVQIKSLLKDLPVHERIEILERLGKQTRQANSIEINKEVRDDANRKGLAKKIDHLPINGELKNG